VSYNAIPVKSCNTTTIGLKSFFVKQSSTKECYCQPPPNLETIVSRVYTCAYARAIYFFKHNFSPTRAYKRQNFIIFKLRSTTEQMSALVYFERNLA
jgi:hypothetical protein